MINSVSFAALRTANIEAIHLLQAGEYSEAHCLFRRILEVFKQALNSEHEDSYTNIHIHHESESHDAQERHTRPPLRPIVLKEAATKLQAATPDISFCFFDRAFDLPYMPSDHRTHDGAVKADMEPFITESLAISFYNMGLALHLRSLAKDDSKQHMPVALKLYDLALTMLQRLEEQNSAHRSLMVLWFAAATNTCHIHAHNWDIPVVLAYRKEISRRLLMVSEEDLALELIYTVDFEFFSANTLFVSHTETFFCPAPAA